jgi:hypothetical protein
MLPVAVNVPGDCAIAVEAWLTSPNKKSAWTQLAFGDLLNLL